MQSQPARELTPEEVRNMTDEQLGHLGLDYDNLSVNSYTLIANEAKRRKVKDIGGRYVFMSGLAPLQQLCHRVADTFLVPLDRLLM